MAKHPNILPTEPPLFYQEALKLFQRAQYFYKRAQYLFECVGTTRELALCTPKKCPIFYQTPAKKKYLMEV